MFPRPKYVTTVVFSIFTLLFSFSSANALVFGEYLRYSLGYDKNEQSTRWIACALIVTCSLLHGVSKRVGSMAQNALGTIKLATLVLVLFTCFYILVLPESLTGIPSNFEPGRFNVPSSFQGSIYATALLKCIHSFGGWTTCHTVQNEIKGPIATLRKAGPLSIVAILILYILLNLCYLKVIPYQDFIDSDQLAGALLFSRVYGRDLGAVLINLLIAISSATNVIIVVYSDSIMNQEIFREGFLPFSKQLCTNYPFGTPVFGILVHCIASCALIYLPKNQVYNRIISVQYYPNQLFHAVLCLGLLFKLRTRFPNIHAPIRASTVTIYVCLVGSLSVVVSPFISGSYYFTLASLGTLAIGFIYWLVAFRIVPLVGRFHYVVVPRRKKDGLIYKQWIKDYDGELSLLLV
ncbi:DEKNAAC103087 [Brettanomyces naardenensis]|uniref:DEKNAAC103087 n=1 Tax=Brettanomyces naardenensis TaxID=13370 RepID=A0A448YMF1_BRENA|nr:DEKNAAC103087 [Brettanomyces naardenensis]